MNNRVSTETAGHSRILAGRRNSFLLLTMAFVVLNAALLTQLSLSNTIVNDSMGYIEPATGVLESGRFVSDIRLPLYPLMLTFFLGDDGRPGLGLILVQLLLHFCTGAVVWRIARIFLSGPASDVVFGIMLFNPPALAAAYSVLPDTLFCFLINASLLLVLRASGRTRWQLGAGILVGLAALARGNGLYLGLVIPLLLLVGRRASGHAVSFPPLVAFLVGVGLMVGPYLAYNKLINGSVGVASDRYRDYAIHENIVYAQAYMTGTPYLRAQEALLDQLELPSRGQMTSVEKHRVIAANASSILTAFPPVDLGMAMAKASGAFFCSNGFSSLAALFGAKGMTVMQLSREHGFSVGLLLEIVRSRYATAFLLAVTHVLVLRALLAVGIVAFVRRQEVLNSLLLLGIVVYFWGTSGFIGSARYRLPIDPTLILLAVYGATVLLGAAAERRKRIESSF